MYIDHLLLDTKATTDGETPSPYPGYYYSSEVSDLLLYDTTKPSSRISDIGKPLYIQQCGCEVLLYLSVDVLPYVSVPMLFPIPCLQL